MFRASLLVVVLALAGCGGSSETVAPDAGPGWDGIYAGPLSASGKCSDGSIIATGPQSTTLQISHLASILQAPLTCGATITAKISGNGATVNTTATCQPQTQNGVTSTLAITGGTFALDGDALAVDLAEHITIAGRTDTCDAVLTGTLVRQ